MHKPLWYCTAFYTALKMLSIHGKHVRDTYKISIAKQFSELLHLAYKRNASPEYYYKLKLYENDDIKIGENYITNSHAGAIHSRLLVSTKNKEIINNKVKFHQHCHSDQNALIDIIAVMSKGNILLSKNYSKLPEGDLFLKPIKGNFGRNCIPIKHRENKYYVGKNDKALTKVEMLKFVADIARRSEPMILQPRISNCSELADLSSGALLTTRIISYIDKTDV